MLELLASWWLPLAVFALSALLGRCYWRHLGLTHRDLWTRSKPPSVFASASSSASLSGHPASTHNGAHQTTSRSRPDVTIVDIYPRRLHGEA